MVANEVVSPLLRKKSSFYIFGKFSFLSRMSMIVFVCYDMTLMHGIWFFVLFLFFVYLLSKLSSF